MDSFATVCAAKLKGKCVSTSSVAAPQKPGDKEDMKISDVSCLPSTIFSRAAAYIPLYTRGISPD
jgi:hypothetical protein